MTTIAPLLAALQRPIAGPAPGCQRRTTLLLLPGVGALLVAGPVVAGGALAGGLIGALVKAGHSQDQAEEMVEQLKSGRYLMVVQTNDNNAVQAETVLRNAGAEKVHIGTTP